MLSHQQTRALTQRIETLGRPLVSVYVAVDPGDPGSDFKTAQLRLRRALERLDAPGDLLGDDPHLAHLIERPPSQPTTFAAFSDGERTETVQLSMLLPVTESRTGETDAAYGEPLRAPLHHALDRERYGVAVVDDQRVRFFEIFAGEIEELWTETRSTIPGEYDQLEQSKQVHPAFVPSRGGAARDNAAHHIDEWTRRLYRHASDRIGRSIAERRIDRLLVAGPGANPKRFAGALPAALGDRVAALLPSLEDPNASEDVVLTRCRDAIDADRGARLRADLARLEGPGGVGGRDCAAALAEGRLAHLILSWQIPRMQRERYLATALAHDTAVRFVTGEIGEGLLRAHHGMLGERRW